MARAGFGGDGALTGLRSRAVQAASGRRAILLPVAGAIGLAVAVGQVEDSSAPDTGVAAASGASTRAMDVSAPGGPGAFLAPEPASSATLLAPASSGSATFVAPDPTQIPPPPEWHEFYFTRAAYSSYGRGWGRRNNSWATDYPKSDRQFLTVLQRLTNLDAFSYENAVLLTDERIRRYPFLYALEVGYMSLSPEEVEGLREYLMAGGFLVIDDFWGTQEWLQFESQMGLVLPNRPIVQLELEHPVFSTFYDIDEILQVPAYGRWGGRTSERDGFVPHVKGIHDDDGRLMVIVNWNTDLGDAWEWAEQPDYPLQFSTFAFQMGVNMIIYAMSH